MPQDAFTIFHTAIELNSQLENARVDKINQPYHDEITLGLRQKGKNLKLLISANPESARVVITSGQKESPISAPAFCMLLRKHLSHSKILSVKAVMYERIMMITFLSENELRESGTKILYVEIMGKYSNITLTENGVILGAIKQSQSIEGLRPIFPGVKFTLPTPQEKVELSDLNKSIDVLNAFNTEDFANYIFQNFKGLSKATSCEIVYRFFGKHYVVTEDIKKININDFYNHFKDFYNNITIEPCTTLDLAKNDFFVTQYKSINSSIKKFKSISDAIDYYYETKLSQQEFLDKKRKLLEAAKTWEKKLNKKYQIALDKILACKDMQNDRIFGELILSNLYRLKDGEDCATVENYYSENMDLITIKLDPDLTLKQNAERYFKRYTKAKNTVAAVQPQIKSLEAELKYVKSIFDEIDLCMTLTDFKEVEEELIEAGYLRSQKSQKSKKSPSKSTYRNYYYQGFTILVGRNNIQNGKLTSEAMRNDIWLHTKDYHSAHVIIQSNNLTIPDQVILFAAEICAYYSKASKSDKVPVDYTLKKYVKKPSGLPQGMVFYTDQKTILVTPDSHDDFKVGN